MEMRTNDGRMLREEFGSVPEMFRRFAELSAQGAKLEKMHIPRDVAPPVVRTEHYEQKYPSKYVAHQGVREAARRRRQMTAAE